MDATTSFPRSVFARYSSTELAGRGPAAGLPRFVLLNVRGVGLKVRLAERFRFPPVPAPPPESEHDCGGVFGAAEVAGPGVVSPSALAAVVARFAFGVVFTFGADLLVALLVLVALSSSLAFLEGRDNWDDASSFGCFGFPFSESSAATDGATIALASSEAGVGCAVSVLEFGEAVSVAVVVGLADAFDAVRIVGDLASPALSVLAMAVVDIFVESA